MHFPILLSLLLPNTNAQRKNSDKCACQKLERNYAMMTTTHEFPRALCFISITLGGESTFMQSFPVCLTDRNTMNVHSERNTPKIPKTWS